MFERPGNERVRGIVEHDPRKCQVDRVRCTPLLNRQLLAEPLWVRSDQGVIAWWIAQENILRRCGN
jgi:hypothetical protein